METRTPTWETLQAASRKPSSQNNFSEQNSVDPDPASPSEALKNNDQLNSNMNHQSKKNSTFFNQRISFFGLRLTKYQNLIIDDETIFFEKKKMLAFNNHELIKLMIIKLLIMSQQASKKSLEKQYLKNLLKKSQNNQTMEQEVSTYISGSMKKIEQQLQAGNLIISNKTKAAEELSKLKQQKYAKDMQTINKQLNQNDEMFKKAKRQLLMQRKAESQMKKDANQAKIKEVSEKVKHWIEIQKQLKEKRQQMERTRQKLQQQQEQRAKREAQEQKQFQRLEKKKQIEQNLKKIEQNKQKRSQVIRASQQQIHQLHPKFIQMQKKFKQFEEEMRFQEQILKKNHKLTLKIDHQAIRAHSKAYLTKVQQRKAARSQSPQSADGSRQKNFNQFYARNEQKIAEQKQKLKRRKEFQQKLKQIPIVIDEAKKVKVQIAIDKGKNRIKYNFLGQKALNDFQIYGQFRDFQLNVNAKEIGKQYLRQLPQITKASRVVKSNSTSTLRQQKCERVKYKDYLQDMKVLRSERGPRTQQQIQAIVKFHKEKAKAISQLNEKSKKYELQAKRKLNQLENYNGLQSVMKKSKEVDQMYLKSIKAKLACLQMQE